MGITGTGSLVFIAAAGDMIPASRVWCSYHNSSDHPGSECPRWQARNHASYGSMPEEGVAAAMRDYASWVPSAVVVDGTGGEDEVAARVLDAVLARAGGRADV